MEVMFSDCEISNTNTVLARGNYLLIFPDNGGVVIHGATGIQPHYNLPDSSIVKSIGDTSTTITCRNGEEVLLIVIYDNKATILS